MSFVIQHLYYVVLVSTSSPSYFDTKCKGTPISFFFITILMRFFPLHLFMIYHSTLVQCNVSIGLNLNLQNSYIVQTNSNFKFSFFPIIMKFSQCALSFVSIYANAHHKSSIFKITNKVQTNSNSSFNFFQY